MQILIKRWLFDNYRLIILFFLSFCFFAACATVPYTERRSFILISEREEIELGETAYQNLMKGVKISDDLEINQKIERIGKRIAKAANKPGYKWEFKVIKNDKRVNAFCLPGGKVAFYTGIIPLCEDEEGIAVVMGHEIAHAIARHGAERLTNSLLAQAGGQLLQKAIKAKSPEAQRNILSVYGVGAQVGVLLPFSRTHEYEADHIGLILMAKSGYNPERAVSFWKRMAELSKRGKPLEFLSTHPADDKRVEQLKERLSEAMKYYKKAN